MLAPRGTAPGSMSASPRARLVGDKTSRCGEAASDERQRRASSSATARDASAVRELPDASRADRRAAQR